MRTNPTCCYTFEPYYSRIFKRVVAGRFDVYEICGGIVEHLFHLSIIDADVPRQLMLRGIPTEPAIAMAELMTAHYQEQRDVATTG